MNEQSILLRWAEYSRKCSIENKLHRDRCGGVNAFRAAHAPDKATRGVRGKEAAALLRLKQTYSRYIAI